MQEDTVTLIFWTRARLAPLALIAVILPSAVSSEERPTAPLPDAAQIGRAHV